MELLYFFNIDILTSDVNQEILDAYNFSDTNFWTKINLQIFSIQIIKLEIFVEL